MKLLTQSQREQLLANGKNRDRDHPPVVRFFNPCGSGTWMFRRTLVRLDYHRLGKPDKGLVRRYLAKVTGLSRAQLTRLIGRHRRTGRIEDRRGSPPAKPFERRYTRLDIRMNNPTCTMLRA